MLVLQVVCDSIFAELGWTLASESSSGQQHRGGSFKARSWSRIAEVAPYRIDADHRIYYRYMEKDVDLVHLPSYILPFHPQPHANVHYPCPAPDLHVNPAALRKHIY